jgi:hypothetical protein
MIVRIERNPTRRQLQVFALSWLVVFGILGGCVWWKNGSLGVAGVLWAVGTVVPVVGLAWPGFLRVAFLAACYATFPIGLVVSYLILAVVYYMVLTPIGFVLRLKGQDPLRRRFDRNAKSYWTPRRQEEDSERYFKQF